MPYRFIEDVAIADAAFEAWGNTLEEMFFSAVEAMLHVMVENVDSISSWEEKEIIVESEDIEMLLFRFLQEFLFYKDAEQIFFRPHKIEIQKKTDFIQLKALLKGEKINPEKHELKVDVKAVTLHMFRVEQNSHGWKSFVIVDV